jgi:hypothetical protein
VFSKLTNHHIVKILIKGYVKWFQCLKLLTIIFFKKIELPKKYSRDNVYFINVIRAPKITKLCFGFEIFAPKILFKKCARKTLMKLTHSQRTDNWEKLNYDIESKKSAKDTNFLAKMLS